MKRIIALLWAVWWANAALGCRCGDADSTPGSKPSSAPAPARQALSAQVAPPSASTAFGPPEALLALPTQAYHTQLVVTARAIHLYSALGLHTLTQTSPPVFTALPTFSVAAMDNTRLLGFAEGALHEVPLSDPKAPRLLGRLTRPPQLLAQHLGQSVWSSSGDLGTSELFSLVHGQVRRIYAAKGTITSLATSADRAYFVEQSPATMPERSWTLMSIPLDGGAAVTGPRHQGRTPAMLHLNEQIFYYHGPERRVFRTSRDFVVEQTAARDVICSPLTAVVHPDSSGQLYCAQLSGIALVDLVSQARQTLPLHPSGPITTMAVGEPGLVYVVDSAREQLELFLLPHRS